MKYKTIVAATLLLLTFGCTATSKVTAPAAKEETGKTQVMLLATLHNFHRTNPNYTYKDVYEIIRKYNPDILGVEIRPEDIDQDTTYLKQMYPLEMRQITVLFPDEKVFGVDWYGEEAAGKLLPADAFKGGNQQLTRIKQLERELNTDTTLTPQRKLIGVLAQQFATLAKTSTPAELNNSGQYDLTADLFYKQMDTMLQGTPYEDYIKFNRQRDVEIGKNIAALIRQNPGRKLIFILGANHRFAAEKTIKESFGDNAQLVPVPKL